MGLGIDRTKYDVCVLGGGPAGSTIAKKLAQFGYSVIIIEKEKIPRSNIGLSLTPGIHHWLDILEVKDEMENAGFIRAVKSLVLWEDDQPIVKEYAQNKAGYHVDRSVFDEILLQSAINDGVKLLRPCTLRKLDYTEKGKWQVTLVHDTIEVSISARFVVEATGRKSILKGSKKAYLPKTMATYAYWKLNSTLEDFTSYIEAGRSHWFWGAPVDQFEFMACVFSDPEEIKKFSSIEAFYFSKIADSTLYNSLKKDGEVGKISVCSATPYQDTSPITQNYIKVGDAAFSMDALSSQGVQKAIKSAFQGAIVVNTLLSHIENSQAAIDYYSHMIETEVAKNTIRTKQFYNRQNRFKGGKFWASRMDNSIPAYYPTEEHRISLRKEDKLVLNQSAEIAKVAVVGENIIEYQKGIYLKKGEEPYVFIQDVPLVPLIDQMNNKPLKEGLKVIHSHIPQSNPVEVLQWMVYHRILCASDTRIKINDNKK